jgi:hypothetical protein
LQPAARLLFDLFLFLALGDAALHLAASTEKAQQLLRPRVEGVLRYELGRDVRVGTVALSPFLNFLELRQVAVTGPGGVADAEIDRVRLYPDLRRLLRRKFVVRTVALMRPVIDFPEGPPSMPGKSEALLRIQYLLALPVDRLEIRQGQLTARREGRMWRADGLHVDLWREAAEIRGELRVAQGVLHLSEEAVQWGPLQATVVLEEHDLVVTLGVSLQGGTLGAVGRVRDVFSAPRLALDIGGQLPFSLHFPSPGTIQVAGQVTGSPEDPRFQGAANLEGGPWPDLGITLVADREGIRSQRMRFLAVPSDLSGGGELRWKDLSYAAQIRGRGLDLKLFRVPGLRRLPVTGKVALEARATGRGLSAAGMTGQATFRVTSLKRLGQLSGGGAAEGHVKAHGGHLSLERLQVDVPPNRLVMQGSLGKELQLEVSGKAPRVDLIGHLLGASNIGGKGEVVGQVTGAVGAPTFRGTLTWDAPRLLGVDLHRIRGTVIVAERMFFSPQLVVTQGKSVGLIRLRMTLPEEEKALDLEHDLRIEAEGQLSGALRDFLSLFVRGEIPTTGRLSLEGNVAGVPARLEGLGRVVVKDAVLWGEPWQTAEADLKLEPDRLQFEQVRLLRGAEQVSGSGFLRLGKLGVSFRLAAPRLSLEGFRLFAAAGLTGRMQLEMEGEGRIDNPTIRGDYHVTALRYGTVPLGVGRGRLLLQDQQMTARLALPNQGYTVLGRLQTIAPYPYEVQLNMSEAEMALLFALTGSPLLQGGAGTGSGEVTMGGDLAPHRLTKLAVAIHAPSLRIRGHTFHTAEPLRVDLRDKTLTISSVAVTGKTGWLNARGHIAFGGAANVSVQGKIPLGLALYYPGIIGGGTGTGEFDLKASGLWKAPRYSGWIKIAGGGFRLLDHPEPLQGITGQVTFGDHEIHIPAIAGRWAGGKVNVSGTASRGQDKGWRWTFDLLFDEAKGERVFVRSEKDARRVTGETSLWGTVTAGGSRWGELKQSLGGKLKLALKDGKIQGFTVVANVLRILNLTPDPVKGVPYDSLKASFELKEAVLETRDLTFVSDTIKIGGVGTIDLGHKEVDMLLAVQPLRTADRVINAMRLSKIPLLGPLLFGKERSVLVVAVKVDGPLDEPEVHPVPEESLGRGMFGILRRLFELPATLAPNRKSSASK